MKREKIHENRLLKEIEKLKEEHSKCDSSDVIFVSDSKGGYLHQQMEDDTKIQIFSLGGAKIDDPAIMIRHYFQLRIRKIKYPLVIFWFGTCELTNKRYKSIEIKPNIDNEIMYLATKYHRIKKYILRVNDKAKVVFLETPYYSIPQWNQLVGKENHTNMYVESQRKLEKAIDRLNDRIRMINFNLPIPRLSQDMTFCLKSNKTWSSHINYELLADGVHQKEILSKLWLLKIHRMVNRLQ